MLDLLLSNNGLAALIAFALVLIPAVIIHELGHFFAGKAVGVTILEFGIGFPPRIGRLFTWRGTEFTLNWLPLGGFVRPLGEDMVRQTGEEGESLDRQEAIDRGITEIKSVNEAKPLQRIVFLSAGAVANLVMAIILFVAVGMIGVTGSRINVVAVDTDSPFARVDLQSGDVIESIDGENFLDSQAFFEKFAYHEGEVVELIVRRGEEGEIIPLTVSGDDFTDSPADMLVRIMGVVPNTPADNAGILPGDVVLSFNGQTIESVSQFITMVTENAGEEISLSLLRGGETIDVSLVPRVDPPPGEGAMGIEIRGALHNLEAGLIFQPLPQQVIVQLSFTESLQYGVDRFNEILSTIARVPAQIFRGNISASEARPVSIVGISQVGGVFLQQSIQEERPVMILNYIAIISIALGLTNLLPLPALDGGRILFVVIEMIRGRPIPPEREGIVHLLGLVFLLSLTVIVIVNDIVNPVTDLLP